MLTPKQHKLFVFIEDTLARKGVSPSFDEMRTFMGLKSKSGIHRMIANLAHKGYIRHLPNQARAIEVIPRPSNVSALYTINNDNGTDIPLVGKIAAGYPIEAVHTNDSITVPPQMLGLGEHWWSKVIPCRESVSWTGIRSLSSEPIGHRTGRLSLLWWMDSKLL